MDINFGSSIPISTVDWHSKVSVVLFLRGCPYRCPYCHNYEILGGSDFVNSSKLEKIIKDSSPFVSNVVFSGGEPLLQYEAVKDLAGYARRLGLLVGIHTNGFYPGEVQKLIDEGLADRFFIDVKAPLNDPGMYARATGHDENESVPCGEVVVEKVRQTISIVTDRRIDHELRTTAIRGFIGDPDDIRAIARSVAVYLEKSRAPYVIQQGLPEHAMKKSMRDILPFSREEMLHLAECAHEYVGNVWVRTKEQGNEKVNFESI
jgi:pyruvate formate lyase activating enzyme